MQMTNDEIVRNYLEAKNPKEQIKILADLNECSAERIRQILKENGVRPKKINTAAEAAAKQKNPLPESQPSELPSLKIALEIINAHVEEINHRQCELDIEKADLYRQLKGIFEEIG